MHSQSPDTSALKPETSHKQNLILDGQACLLSWNRQRDSFSGTSRCPIGLSPGDSRAMGAQQLTLVLVAGRVLRDQLPSKWWR